MEKKYIQIEALNNLEDAVLELIKYPIEHKGRLACCYFNGQMLYSDTVSLDSAYKAITEMAYFDFKEMLRSQREIIKKKEDEFKTELPDKTSAWIKRGHEILDSSKWDYWDKIVPIRAEDIYHGMELDASLDIIEILNQDKNDIFKIAKQMIEKQDHSGMLFSLVCAMLQEFSNKGKDFVDYLNKKGE